jgi:ferredoxin
MGRYRGAVPVAASAPNAAGPGDVTQKVQALKTRVQDLLNQLAHRIGGNQVADSDASSPLDRPSTTPSRGEEPLLVAVIDGERCSLCGRCVDVCPEQAITMDDAVTIDSGRCTACGVCVDECPSRAISLSSVPQRAAS